MSALNKIVSRRARNVHFHSFQNEREIRGAPSVYCFSCRERFDSKDVTSFRQDGLFSTGLCPNCSSDTLLASTVEWDDRIERELHDATLEGVSVYGNRTSYHEMMYREYAEAECRGFKRMFLDGRSYDQYTDTDLSIMEKESELMWRIDLDGDGYVLLGDIYSDSASGHEDTTKALYCYDRAVEVDNPKAYLRLGELAMEVHPRARDYPFTLFSTCASMYSPYRDRALVHLASILNRGSRLIDANPLRAFRIVDETVARQAFVSDEGDEQNCLALAAFTLVSMFTKGKTAEELVESSSLYSYIYLATLARRIALDEWTGREDEESKMMIDGTSSILKKVWKAYRARGGYDVSPESLKCAGSIRELSGGLLRYGGFHIASIQEVGKDTHLRLESYRGLYLIVPECDLVERVSAFTLVIPDSKLRDARKIVARDLKDGEVVFCGDSQDLKGIQITVGCPGSWECQVTQKEYRGVYFRDIVPYVPKPEEESEPVPDTPQEGEESSAEEVEWDDEEE